MKDWSKSWKGSKQPRKQRKYSYNAPLHIIRKMFSVALNKELRKLHGTRNVIIRKGDKVKVLRGQFKGKSGKVDKVSFVRRKIVIFGIDLIKKDGNKVPYNIHPSNLVITELNLEDKKRKEKLGKK